MTSLATGLNKLFYFLFSRQTKDTVNCCVLVNKLLELIGDERMKSDKKKTYKCPADEQFRLANSK